MDRSFLLLALLPSSNGFIDKLAESGKVGWQLLDLDPVDHEGWSAIGAHGLSGFDVGLNSGVDRFAGEVSLELIDVEAQLGAVIFHNGRGVAGF